MTVSFVCFTLFTHQTPFTSASCKSRISNFHFLCSCSHFAKYHWKKPHVHEASFVTNLFFSSIFNRLTLLKLFLLAMTHSKIQIFICHFSSLPPSILSLSLLWMVWTTFSAHHISSYKLSDKMELPKSKDGNKKYFINVSVCRYGPKEVLEC